MGTAAASDHVILVHFPSAHRVKQIIDELLSDPVHRNRDIVIVTDQVEKLPFSIDRVLFVFGSPLEVETFERAHVASAKMALVLATSYSDPNSDAVVASAVSVLDRLHPSMHIVAECLDERHRQLFSAVRCDAIVPGLRIAGNLLVQEVHDPGISQSVDVITSNLKGMTLYSAEVTESMPGVPYSEVAKKALDTQVNLLCVNRGENVFAAFKEIQPQEGDRVVYVASQRFSWPEILQRTT